MIHNQFVTEGNEDDGDIEAGEPGVDLNPVPSVP